MSPPSGSDNAACEDPHQLHFVRCRLLQTGVDCVDYVLLLVAQIAKEQCVHAGVKQSCQCLGLAKPELGFPVQLLIQRVGGDLQRSCHVLLLQTAFPNHSTNIVHILIADEVKPDSNRAIAELKKIGVEKTVMLTGDDERIGKSVADELGLDAYYAQLLPDQKVEKLEMLDKQKRQGSKLAFVGDGINDAPVLARADVGIAMGGLGSDAAIEAADVVLMTDEPSKLVEAIDVAKATKRIVMQNIVIALGIKSVFLVLGALGMAGMWEAVFGDVGVTIIAVLNAMRILKK